MPGIKAANYATSASIRRTRTVEPNSVPSQSLSWQPVYIFLTKRTRPSISPGSQGS